MQDKTSTVTTVIKHSASWWEFLAISVGAVLLIGVGLTGLGIKALNSATDPRRAEAMARSIVDYQIPGGSKGAFSAKIGGIRAALITSNVSPPDVELFVAQIAEDEEIDRSQLPINFGDTRPEREKEQFKAISTRRETKNFCGLAIPVTVQEGELTWQSQALPIPAIRYSASAPFKNSDRFVQLTTSGNNAKQRADTIFDSFKCQ